MSSASSNIPVPVPPTPHRPATARLFGRMLDTPDVRAALRDGRMILAYQPVMQAPAPDRPAFHEALLRLRLPCGEIVTPGRFLPQLGDGAMARALDRHALTMVLQDLGATPGIRLSVNAAPGSLSCAHWHAVLRDGIAAGGPMVAERLIIEVTEHRPLPAAARIAPLLDAARGAGVCLALDDFGAGHTAFRHLRDWRFDIIKVAGCFARGVDRCGDNQVLFKTLAGLGRHFEAMVVAEGVETAAEANWLRRAGIDALQGYHLARPALDVPWRHTAPRQTGTRRAG